MIKKFTNSIFLQTIALGAVIFAFFYDTLKMQFWKDDHGLIYNLQQNEPFPYPYHHLLDLHAPIFSFFGTNPQGYFALGIIFVFIASVSFYYLVYKLFSNKIAAFMASLVFVSAPIGIDTIFMAMTFATTYFFIALFLVALIFIVKFHESNKLRNYIIALSLLAINFELTPFRSFFLIGAVFFFELIYLKINKQTIINFISRQFTLALVWILIFYINPVFFLPQELKLSASQAAGFFQQMFDYKLLLHPLLTSINIIFSGFAFIFYQNFYIKNIAIALALLVGINAFFLYMFFLLKRKKSNLLKPFIFSVLFLYFTSLAFYSFSQKEISTGAFRYMSGSLPAYSLLIICIYFFLFKIFKKNKKMRFLPIFFISTVILINSVTTQIYIKDFNTRSNYAKEFSLQMKKFLPNLPKNALIYYQLDEDPQVNYRLYDTSRGGHYDDRAYFAVLYGLKQEEINLAYGDFSILLNNVEKKQIDRDKIFAFKYGENGLTDITGTVKKLLNDVVKDKK